MGHKSRRAKQRRQGRGPNAPRVDLNLVEMMAILERAKQAPLSEEDHAKLKVAMETLGFITQELLARTTSLEQLRYLLFGSKTEKTSSVLGEQATTSEADEKKISAKTKPKGHGRNGSAAYTGAEKVKVPHPSLKPGADCPDCKDGHVYLQPEPSTLVRITGMAPLAATLYERERWRCSTCGEVFTAPSPQGVGEEKYDEKAISMVGLLKYGTGLPFSRIEKLQEGMGIPLPAATQWELVAQGQASRCAMLPSSSRLLTTN